MPDRRSHPDSIHVPAVHPPVRRSFLHTRWSKRDHRVCSDARLVLVKTANPLKPLSPRDYLANPRHFGRFNKVDMNEDAVQAHPEAATAARWQYLIAVRARIALHFRGITHEEFAKQMGREKQYLYDRLNRQR